jgi:2-dehydro-3-deoxy-D-arabinonate dehydratase
MEGEYMYLTRHQTNVEPRWALDGYFLPASFSLSFLLELPRDTIIPLLRLMPTNEPAQGESRVGDVYEMVYDASRPELFLKALGWRVVGHAMPIRIRADSHWNVPEPELVLIVNCHQEIVGLCAGNDVSSRDIEGENPLYLPQAKIYNGSCALGPGILLADADEIRDLPIQLEILREEKLLFQGQTRTSNMRRRLEDLVAYLGKELDFPKGVFLMTGTGIVPPDDFTLKAGDLVRISVASLVLENRVWEEGIPSQ